MSGVQNTLGRSIWNETIRLTKFASDGSWPGGFWRVKAQWAMAAAEAGVGLLVWAKNWCVGLGDLAGKVVPRYGDFVSNGRTAVFWKNDESKGIGRRVKGTTANTR